MQLSQPSAALSSLTDMFLYQTVMQLDRMVSGISLTGCLKISVFLQSPQEEEALLRLLDQTGGGVVCSQDLTTLMLH